MVIQYIHKSEQYFASQNGLRCILAESECIGFFRGGVLEDNQYICHLLGCKIKSENQTPSLRTLDSDWMILNLGLILKGYM